MNQAVLQTRQEKRKENENWEVSTDAMFPVSAEENQSHVALPTPQNIPSLFDDPVIYFGAFSEIKH